MRTVKVLVVVGLGVVVLVVGGALVLWAVEAWADDQRNLPERSDVEARCPDRPGLTASLDLGGVAEPDFCVWTDANGSQIGDAWIAAPVP